MRFALMIEPQQGQAMATRSQSPNAPRPTASKRSSAPTTTPASRAGQAADHGRLGCPRRALSGVDRIGLGALVSPVTFRHREFAEVVTTVDEMSGGRIEVGPAPAERPGASSARARFPAHPGPRRPARGQPGDALLGLWGEPDGWSYQVTGSGRWAVFHPRPVDVPGRPRTPIGGARPRLLIGGRGRHDRSALPPNTATSSTSTAGPAPSPEGGRARRRVPSGWT
jgi:hypothetical protein